MATDWLAQTRDAYEAASAFMDTNYRADLDYSIRAFRQEHASGSKYLSDEYKARSRLVSPKTRSVIRKTEAAGAVALFSNMDIVNLEPGNPDDPMSVASTAAMKAILEYRLGKTIPTFQICMGGIQDAQTQGAVVSYQYWDYQEKNSKKVKDKPCIELRPMENIRLDGGASWIDPVGTTPYLCDIIPMYVCDVRAMMASRDDKTGQPKWKKYDDADIMQALPDKMDTTRKARLGNQQDPHLEKTGIKSFDVVWVMRWFMRDAISDDYCYYTLGTHALLTDPKPIEETYFHGVRPYAMGYAILETHKVMKTSVPTLVKPIQLESTDLRNQRLDNVKFVLNKRWIVARGRNVDVQSLVRNVPGGVTMTTDPKNDLQESNWPDVTSSSFVEHDRLTAEFDDLVGNFSPSTRVANNAVNDTLGGSKMAAQSAGIMTDYMLRTVVETWWESVLRQLTQLESAYETDQVVLGVCAQKARLFPKYGLSQITDEMLAQEMHLTVNVGFGSSDPTMQLQKFISVTREAIAMVTSAPPGFNVSEAIKEMYSKCGYRDGARFFSEQQDPRLSKAMQMIQQLTGVVKGKQLELQANAQLEQQKLSSNERVKGAEIEVNQMRIRGDLTIRQAELVVEQQRLELEKFKLQAELNGAGEEQQLRVTELVANIEQAQLKLEGERQKILGQSEKLQQELEKGRQEMMKSALEAQTTAQLAENSTKATQSMDDIAAQIAGIQSSLDDTKTSISELGNVKEQLSLLRNGIALMMQNNIKPERKAIGMKIKKDGKTTRGVAVEFDDGTVEDMAVNVG